MGKIIDSLYENVAAKDKGIVYIKHYNTLALSMDEVTGLLPEDRQMKVLYYTFTISDIMDAYDPWLAWVRQIYFECYSSKMTSEEFVKQCGVYELQKSVVISYINTGICMRWEDIIIGETKFERGQFLKSLLNIYKYILKNNKVMFILDKVHLADYASLSFLTEFMKLDDFTNTSMLITYNDVYSVQSSAQNLWHVLQEIAENGNMVFDWTVKEGEEVIETNTAFIPVEEKIDEYINKCNNMVLTLAIPDALHYLEILYGKIVCTKNDIPEFYLFNISYLYAFACLCNEEATIGLHVCEMISAFKITKDDPGYQYQFVVLQGLVQIALGQFAMAEKYSEESIEIARTIGDEHKIFRGKLLSYVAKFKGWRDLFACSFDFEIEDEFMKKLDDKRYYNHLGYMYCFGFENDESFFFNDKDIVNNMFYFQRGIQIGEFLNNTNLIIEAYKKCITLASAHGYFEPVDFYYNKCLEILKNSDDNVEIANIYSGLGYNRIVSEKYNKANAYFNMALKKLYDLKMPEYLGEILYNMSINAFIAEEYQVASDYMIDSIKILNLMGISRLRVCNITKMYGIIAVSNYYLGVEYNCYLYINLMERVLSHLFVTNNENDYIFWDDDLFLYYLVKALLNLRDGNLKLTKEMFDKAEYHMSRSSSTIFFGYSIYATEIADYYRLIGDDSSADDVLNRCIDMCRSKGYIHKAKRLTDILEHNETSKKKYDFSLTEVSLEKIFELAKYKGLTLEVKSKEKDINFLTLWQELINRDSYVFEEEIVNAAVMTLKSYYGVDRTVYIEIEDGTEYVRYCDKEIEMTDELRSNIVNQVSKIGKEFVANRISRSFDEYSKIVELFGKNDVVSMVGVVATTGCEITNIFINYVTMYENFSNRQVMLNENNLLLFKCVFKQLIDAIDRVRSRKKAEIANKKLSSMNLQLEKLAVTDQLTGLINRQGLNKKIEEEFSEGTIGKGNNLSVMYIDLDNFKYYNDRFGHDIGDKLLVTMAETFRKLIGQEGYAVRYGGDEFVIILPFRKLAKAEEYAKCILYEVEQESLYERIGISKEELAWAKRLNKTLSTSIGISQAEECNSDAIFEALRRADKALYYIKKNKKAGYKVWDKTLDQLI